MACLCDDPEARERQGLAGEMLYHAARYALAGGLTRSEYDNLSAFMFGQAAADHAHAVGAAAAPGARRGDERVEVFSRGPLLGWELADDDDNGERS